MALEVLRGAKKMRSVFGDRGTECSAINFNPLPNLLGLSSWAKVSHDGHCTIFQDRIARHVQRAVSRQGVLLDVVNCSNEVGSE